jgi:membrane-associated phospholipid phosphatase
MLADVTITAPPRAETRLLTRNARRWALGLAVVLGAFVIALGVDFAGDRTASAWDIRVMLHLYSWYPDRRSISPRIADLGGTAAIGAAVLVLLVVLYATQRYRAAVLAVLGPLVASGLTEWVLKPSIDRRILGYVTYPSGHTTGAFSIATVLAVVLLGTGGSRVAARVSATVVVFALACLVAVSLVVAGYHVPTDTLGGAGLGIATVLAVAVVIDAVADRRAVRSR